MSNNQVAKLPIDAVAACMTCPICKKLFRDATTIPECLHTFCRKCIHKKFSDEDLECCPICNIDLGCVPMEKLRPDHNIQDIRDKIFPSKRKRVKAPEVVPSVTLPLRRKERSLSSLVVSTPRVSTQTTMPEKMSKVTPRKKSRASNISIDKPFKKEEDSTEDHQDSSSSREILNNFAQNLRQNSSTAEQSGRSLPKKETNDGSKPWEGGVDAWNPLNYLAEVANRRKSIVKSEAQTAKSEGNVRKPKGKDQSKRLSIQDEIGSFNDDATESSKPKKLRRNSQKKAGALGESSVTTLQAVMDAGASNGGHDKSSNPVWFHLVPSEQQEGEPLGRIEGRFVRIKEGNAPVSFIQKYVMNKLNLANENEVELRCFGQPVDPTITVRNLLEQWLQTHPISHPVSAIIGQSAEEYVMVISYSRKAPHCS